MVRRLGQGGVTFRLRDARRVAEIGSPRRLLIIVAAESAPAHGRRHLFQVVREVAAVVDLLQAVFRVEDERALPIR